MSCLARFAPLITLAAACGAHAAVTLSASGGGRAASVSFEVVNNQLQVTLSNTVNADVVEPVGILTAVFFSVSGAPVTFTPQSALLGAGSTVLFGSAGSGGSVGGEWAYKGNPMGGYTAGISSSGLGIFGPHDLFGGTNLQGPDSPDGMNYGLTSAADNPATGNTPVTGTNALIKNQAVFRLGGVSSGFDLARINSVRFQYGTSLSEPHLDVNVPAPGSIALLALGGFVAVGVRPRRR